MHIAGKRIQLRESISVVLKGKNGPVEILLGCLPLGFPVVLERVLPEPVPPKTGRCVKDERGDFVLFNGKPIPEVDWSNAEYRRAKAEHDTLVSVYMLYTAMKAAMPALEFDAETTFPDESMRDKSFASSLEHEFARDGFSLEAIRTLLGKLREINGLDGAAEVGESFLSQQGNGEAPKSPDLNSVPAPDDTPVQPTTGSGEPTSVSE